MRNKNGIPVHVDVTTLINDGVQTEKTSTYAEGMLFSKGNTAYIRYTESIESAGSVRNIVKVTKNDVTIIRNGAVSMRQRFQQGKTTEGEYKSSIATLKMTTSTKHINYDWRGQQSRGHFRLTYDLKLQGRDVGEFTLTLELKEVTEE